LDYFQYNIEKCYLRRLQDHCIMVHIIPLTCFFKVIIHDWNHMCEMVTFIIWNENDIF
jgi:hypothetical protein